MNFSEKVRWHMLNDQKESIALLQDKYLAKKLVKLAGMQVADLFFVTDNAREIPFSKLPADCVIKANHGSGWNILRREGELFRFGTGQHILAQDGSLLPKIDIKRWRISEEECIEQCDKWLRSKYSDDERSYHLISPKIIVEEFLKPPSAYELRDYRLYTFNGVVQAISIGSPTYRRLNQNIFFTPDWKEIQLSRYKEARPSIMPLKPCNLGLMISWAKQLCRDIEFVRLDLYETSRGLVFGEYTFYPHGGAENTPTACPMFNNWLGSGWAPQVEDKLVDAIYPASM